MFIRNAWYVAGLSSEIKSELFARTLLNEQVVMYRTSDGKVAALENRCSHRQVPLSKGCLKNDQLECWYHGIRFDTAGNCVHIPSQKIIPQRANVRSFPVTEKHGFVWIWMGDPKRCEESQIPDHSVCVSPDYVGEMFYCHGKADYRFGIDNFLDPSHVAFVHPNTVMSQAVSEATPEIEIKENLIRVRRVLEKEKASPMLKQIMNLEYIDRVQDALFWPVGNTRIDTIAYPPGQPDGPSMRLTSLGIFTPETEHTAHIWSGIYRNFALTNEKLSKVAAQELYNTMMEDVNIVEHVYANWKKNAPVIHLAVDQASIAARQILDNLLKQESQEQAQSVS